MKQFSEILKICLFLITIISLTSLIFYKSYNLSTIILISFNTLFSLNLLCWIEVIERISKNHYNCGDE